MTLIGSPEVTCGCPEVTLCGCPEVTLYGCPEVTQYGCPEVTCGCPEVTLCGCPEVTHVVHQMLKVQLQTMSFIKWIRLIFLKDRRYVFHGNFKIIFSTDVKLRWNLELQWTRSESVYIILYTHHSGVLRLSLCIITLQRKTSGMD